MEIATTRRALLAITAGAALIPVAVVSAAKPTPELDRLIAEYRAARERLDSPGRSGIDLEVTNKPLADRLEAEYLEAIDQLDSYEPQNADEFVRAFYARFDDGAMPNDDLHERMIADALRIGGGS
jgi:hypothetical protein